MKQKGFGLFGRGQGYYAPTAAFLLLQYFVKRRFEDEDFLDALGRVSSGCGASFLNGELTVFSQNSVAFSAVVKSAQRPRQYGSELNAKIDNENKLQTITKHPANESYESLRKASELNRVVVEKGKDISAMQWGNIFTERGTTITFAKLSRAIKVAFDSIVIEQTDIFHKNFPEAAPSTENELRMDIGGYILTGYIIGRYLLGNQNENLSEFTKGDPETVARALRQSSNEIPDIMGLMSAGGDGLGTFLDIHLADQVRQRAYGRIRARDKAIQYVLLPVLNGFALAMGEYRLMSESPSS